MLDDKIKVFINGCGALVLEKDVGYAFNKVYSSPFLIRPETIDKIKKLLYDDLMFTCEEDNNELCQEIPNNNLISFIAMNEIWKNKGCYINCPKSDKCKNLLVDWNDKCHNYKKTNINDKSVSRYNFYCENFYPNYLKILNKE